MVFEKIMRPGCGKQCGASCLLAPLRPTAARVNNSRHTRGIYFSKTISRDYKQKSRVVTTVTRVITRQIVLSAGLSLQVRSRSAIDFVASRGSVFGPLFAFKWLVKLLFVLDRFNRFQPNAIHEFKLHAHSPAGVHMPADYRLNLIAFALRQRVERFTNVLRKLHNPSSFSKNRPQRRRKTRWRDESHPRAFPPISSGAFQAATSNIIAPSPLISNETAAAWIVAAILTAS